MKRIPKPLLLAALVGAALMASGCAQPKNQQQKANNLRSGASSKNITPTNTTPTAVEGLWASDCFPGSYSNGMQSMDIGYIFQGNSFFLERDYYASNDCAYDPDDTIEDARAKGDVISDAACGWFTLGNATNGQGTIDMTSAMNCGPSEYNVFKTAGTGSSAVLYLGTGGATSPAQRPASATIEYDRWDGSL